MLALLSSLLVVVMASIVIMYACNSFDFATSYLGRKMPAGVKGATLNAVGSSLPELLTTTFLLFLYHDKDGFSAGIATCAGSAVFNAVVIPALCILVVTLGKKKLPYIELDRKTVLRDGFFFILAEVCLIYFLKDSEMAWWMGGALMVVYACYFGYLMWQYVSAKSEQEDEDEDDYDWNKSFLKALFVLDFHRLYFNRLPQSTGRAWAVLASATAVIAAACYYLSEAVINSADALGVPAYFTAVILGAAATSVPDTIISMKDARAGNYDDAVSNAIGSNIFDICICLGLPLFVYGIVYGNVALSGMGPAHVQELRIALVFLTTVGLGIFLSKTKIGKWKGFTLAGLYGLWTTFILIRAMKLPWVVELLGN